jgi:hypothetical protein
MATYNNQHNMISIFKEAMKAIFILFKYSVHYQSSNPLIILIREKREYQISYAVHKSGLAVSNTIWGLVRRIVVVKLYIEINILAYGS